MAPKSSDQPLNLISTQWSLVRRAHEGPVESVNAARQQLLERYEGAVKRYLHRLLLDANAVEEVSQEFALQMVHGQLRGADPQRGRFRNFVKGTLFHLVADYRKQQRRWPRSLPADAVTLAADPPDVDSDRLFMESWCDDLLARAWAALAESDAATGQAFYTVLRFRADHPQLRSPQMAEQLAAHMDKPWTAAGVRQTLHRARERFAALLLDEVIHSLDDPTSEQVHQELAELGLLDYCRPALERHLSENLVK